MKTVYRFKEAAHLPTGLDAQLVGERIARLKELGGGFTAEKVVDDARSESSPLHAAFTWDDAVAAERQRLSEAGYLVRSIVTIRKEADGSEREDRAFVPVVVREVEERRYLPIATAMSDDDYREQVLRRALGEMLTLRRKYRDLEALARIFAAIDETAEQLTLVAA
jgi:hypothetical protein